MKKAVILILCFTFLRLSLFSQEARFAITHGPYIQGLGENEITLVWTTNRKGTAWVELAPDDETHFYLKEHPKYYAESHGFREVDSVHTVKIIGLKANTKYRYRVYSQEVLSHVGTKVLYGNIAATVVYQKKPLEFTTSNPEKQDVSFVVVNDIHGRNDMLENLLKDTGRNNTDMVFFNGDMTNDIRSEDQLFADFMDKAVDLFAREMPLYYVRGNHETRGNFATTFPKYFPTPTGQLYYMFRQGPVCFVVLDSGEDKPDSDMEYSGIVAFDNYRSQQAAWLKEAVKQNVFQDAPFRVVLVHMPPFGGWHGEQEIADKFVPVLEEAGIDLMLCGHLHRHIYKEAGEGQNFPIIANSNTAILKGTAQNNTLNIEVIDSEGKLVQSLKIPSGK